MPPLRTSSAVRGPPARAAMMPTPRAPSTALATPPTSCRLPSKAGTAPRYTTQCPQPPHPLFIPHPHLYPVFPTFFHLTILMNNTLTPAYQPAPVDYRSSPAAPPPERPGLNNPLPEPPRESPFNSKKASLRPSSKHSNDYWTKYNGITTAHLIMTEIIYHSLFVAY